MQSQPQTKLMLRMNGWVSGEFPPLHLWKEWSESDIHLLNAEFITMYHHL